MNEIEIEKQKLKLLKKLISIASDLDLVLAVEDSIKVGNNISKFNPIIIYAFVHQWLYFIFLPVTISKYNDCI